MPSKRKRSEVSADARTPAVPPQLPPSVEEAYRRKCVELKRRNRQVEDANDAARIRIARIQRQVEKLRVERAFLLEQITKRTSTNVEDSEGSPSPPPGQDFDFTLPPKEPLSDTEIPVRKPKEKAARNYKNKAHGKTNATADAASEAAGDNADPGDDLKDEELPDAAPAPAHDSATPAPEESKDDLDFDRLSNENPSSERDLNKDGELPGEEENSAIGAFNVFARLRREELAESDTPDDDVRATLLTEWKSLPLSQKRVLDDKFLELGSSLKIVEHIRESGWQPPSFAPTSTTKVATPPQSKDEDVEMEDGDADAEKSEAPADKEE